MARSAPRSINNRVTGKPASLNWVTAWKMAVCPPTPASSTRRAGVDVRPAVEEQGGRRGVAVFRGHVQERSAAKHEAAPAALAAVEFGETPVHECGVGVDQLGQTSTRPRSNASTAGASYLVSPPASRRMSMQALSRSGERPYDPMR